MMDPPEMSSLSCFPVLHNIGTEIGVHILCFVFILQHTMYTPGTELNGTVHTSIMINTKLA